MKYCFSVDLRYPFTVQCLLRFARVGLKGALVLVLSGSGWADRLPVLSPLPDTIFSVPQKEVPARSRVTPAAGSVIPERATERPVAERAADSGPDFYVGIKSYREGDYRQAERIFELLHLQQPENTQITYYLAITQAQLGRFQKAEALYKEIIQLEPKGKAASLAQKGLDYLPKEDDLDLPPRFVHSPKDSPSDTSEKSRSAQVAAASPPASAGEQTAAMAQAMRQSMQAGMQGMSPQDWMMMQMLQSQGQTNGAGANMNPMSWMMMPGMNGALGGSGYDPGVMSNMMMNQMMQGFGMDGNSEQNP